MSEIFFIADTHFGHNEIIKYENRPFSDTDEMDRILISNWNNTVSDNDTVFMLGDFSLYPKDKSQEICQCLKGKKFLVMGNHDTQSEIYYREIGFESVSKYPIIIENFWILSHEPLYINKNMPYANIFGHVHSNPIYKDFSPQSFCVSAERINYTPLDFNTIRKEIAK